jgi:ABC-type taurine transport system substrate-binding protein
VAYINVFEPRINAAPKRGPEDGGHVIAPSLKKFEAIMKIGVLSTGKLLGEKKED